MPLKGQAKTDYQRDYMRKRRGSNNGSNTEGLTGSNQGKLDRLRELIANPDALTTSPLEESTLPIMTQENYRQFSPGDKVMVKRGKRMIVTTVPELDRDGHPIPDV